MSSPLEFGSLVIILSKRVWWHYVSLKATVIKDSLYLVHLKCSLLWHSLVQPSHHTVQSPCHMERPLLGASAGRCTRGAQAPSYSSAGSRRVNERVSLQMSALSHGLPTPWSRVSYPCRVLQFLTLCIHGPNKMTVLLGHHVCSGLLFSSRLCEQCGKNVYLLSRKLRVHSQLQNWESELQPAVLHAIWSTCLPSAVLEHETWV